MRANYSNEGRDVVAINNDMRSQFFGPAGSAEGIIRQLVRSLPRYRHLSIAIWDLLIRDLFCAEQIPIHPRAGEVCSMGGDRMHLKFGND